ncbi:hypothetical protein HGD80_03185 [Paulownia witches'-broom phytoplasma]|uniref:Uncharacterized protein n=1 Tax=Paulownia witches'-broom phytoplasma TaxID=39647 RepID=A0ABX8TQE7_9MOLU|nr:hypothetical protein [Paulownia witches'-broom phytoplasma]QYC30785.1 hypothetical protein HGD80_03185 [Paulownia witches'-broom phytoplasma]
MPSQTFTTTSQPQTTNSQPTQTQTPQGKLIKNKNINPMAQKIITSPKNTTTNDYFHN